MSKKLIPLAFVLAAFVGCKSGNTTVQDAGSAYVSEVWSPDNGDGTYTNPVLYADYSDPDACAVGDDYYLTASSFNCIPGLPILHSKDLVNWEIVGHALKELEPRELFDAAQHGKGVWAPCIKYHDGEFYIYWGDPDFGIFMVKTTDPRGDWEKPVCVVPGKGMIDPSPLWDEDGRCYLVNGWAGSRAGFNSVLTVRELSADGSKAIGNPTIVFDGGNENHTAEGPKFYKWDGYYWIFCPAGGVKTGWQLAMRSKDVYGPYEAKMVMAQGNTDVNGPHQGAWVHTAQGEDWFLHFNDKYEYGRVVYLQPMKWLADGWPVIGEDPDGDGCGQPVTSFSKPKSSSNRIVNPAETDEFTNGYGLQWQWHANYDQKYGMPLATGGMRLYNNDLSEDFVNLYEAPNLFLQKLPAKDFTATTKVRIASKEEGQYSGIIMVGDDYRALVALREGDGFKIQLLDCKGAFKSGAQTSTDIATLPASYVDPIDYSPAIYLHIYLAMKVADGKCQFFYSTDGSEYLPAGDAFAMKAGRWIGAKMGYVSECCGRKSNRGWLDAYWFKVSKDFSTQK